MNTYILRRLLVSIPIVLGVATATFVMLYLLPGDPVQAMLAQSGASAETITNLRRQLGLDDPPHVRYVRFLWQLVQGDLGRSITTQQPVVELIRSQLPATLQLAVAALLVASISGVGLGVLAAVFRGTWIDRLSMLVAIVGVSMPQFWVGVLFIMVFSFQLRLLPATGTEGVERLIMPATVLGLGSAATLARLVRASMLDVLAEDFIRTAWAKGLPGSIVLTRHALRNGLVPVLAYMGVQFGWLLAGTVVTETVFSRQGIGRLMVSAIEAKDFPVVQGVVLFIALMCVLLNLLVDLSYAVADPRLRHA
jgi:ABC-type dipeptide/oligopeptide/nickel transport system permease component